MESCIYEGRVHHDRFGAVPHRFSARLFLMYLDLDELPELFRGRLLWSASRPALARFRREDHLGDPEQPLADAVRDLVERRGARRPRGPIRLLTHLRYLGYVFNPISLYYCFDADGVGLECVVADVANTPWNERHRYVLADERPREGPLTVETRKVLHVSPFLAMDMSYRWRVSQPGEKLALGIENWQEDARVFAASLALHRREIDGRALASVLARYPLMTVQVIAGIFWQALRLRRKRARWYPHPGKREEAMELARR